MNVNQKKILLKILKKSKLNSQTCLKAEILGSNLLCSSQ